MLVVGIVGQFMHEASATNITLIVVGAGAVVIAPLLPRLREFTFGATGAAAKFLDAEDDIEKGNLLEADKAVNAVNAVIAAPPMQATATMNAPQVELSGTVIPPNVSMTPDAMAALARLGSDDRVAVESAMATLNGNDPRAIEPGSGGRSYFVRRVAPQLRLYYRLMDKRRPNGPDQWVVVNIQAQ